MPDEVKPQNLPAPKPALTGGGAIRAIVPDNFDSAYRLATAIAASGMVPKGYSGPNGPNVSGICVAILHGLEVGFTPMAALQSIAVVNGAPTIFGDGALGLVQASGMLEDIEETVEPDKDGTPLVAKCRVKRRDRKQWVEQTFTQVEARKAGLWSKAGPWAQYPRRMMQMRARSWALRDCFPDVLRGLQIREETIGMVDVTERGSHTMAPPEPTRAEFRQQQAVDVEHDEDGVVADAPAADDAPADAQGPDSALAGHQPRDWTISGNTVAERVAGFEDAYTAAATAGDVAEIDQQNKDLLATWARGKADSPYARASAAVTAAREARLGELAGA